MEELFPSLKAERKKASQKEVEKQSRQAERQIMVLANASSIDESALTLSSDFLQYN